MGNNGIAIQNYNNNPHKRKKHNYKIVQYVVLLIITFIILFASCLLIMGFAKVVSAIFHKEVIPEKSTNIIATLTDERMDSIPEITELNTEEIIIEETKPEENYVNIGSFRITAYCGCSKCCGQYGNNRPKDDNGKDIVITASGHRAIQGVTIAADKSIFPFGTKLYINGNEYTVQDVGGSIDGNKLDIYFENHQDAVNFGVQYMDVFVKSN